MKLDITIIAIATVILITCGCGAAEQAAQEMNAEPASAPAVTAATPAQTTTVNNIGTQVNVSGGTSVVNVANVTTPADGTNSPAGAAAKGTASDATGPVPSSIYQCSADAETAGFAASNVPLGYHLVANVQELNAIISVATTWPCSCPTVWSSTAGAGDAVAFTANDERNAVVASHEVRADQGGVCALYVAD